MSKIQKVAGKVKVNSVKTEVCFYVDVPQGNGRIIYLLRTQLLGVTDYPSNMCT